MWFSGYVIVAVCLADPGEEVLETKESTREDFLKYGFITNPLHARVSRLPSPCEQHRGN